MTKFRFILLFIPAGVTGAETDRMALHKRHPMATLKKSRSS